MKFKLILIGFTLCAQVVCAQEQALSSSCGSLQNAYGPYDYTKAADRRDRLPIVEGGHLSADVLQLRKGKTGVDPLGDLDYTLRAFPNHPLALDAMARLHRSRGMETLPGGRYSMTCWFDRARRLNPTDGVVPLIEGVHLFSLGKYDEAERSLLEAIDLLPASPEAHYNLGLLYVRMEKIPDAVEQAKLAYGMGYPLAGLRHQLEELGQWPPD